MPLLFSFSFFFLIVFLFSLYFFFFVFLSLVSPSQEHLTSFDRKGQMSRRTRPTSCLFSDSNKPKRNKRTLLEEENRPKKDTHLSQKTSQNQKIHQPLNIAAMPQLRHRKGWKNELDSAILSHPNETPQSQAVETKPKPGAASAWLFVKEKLHI